MDYGQAIEYLRKTHKFGQKMGLDCTRELLRRLGDPHYEFKSIHVAGTNGKGSVTAMLSHILKSAGFKTGMYISPCLERFTERIQVDLTEIREEDVARLIQKVKFEIDNMLDEGHNHPTEFEIVTALGFLYFAERKVDIAVIEVGLGGRLDSTNVIEPLLSVITSIGFDHMDVLGDTLGKIAFEKAGIIKNNTPTVIYPQDKEALDVMREVANQRQSELFEVSLEQLEVKYSKFGEQCFDFEFEGNKIQDIAINLNGAHQILNAATALTALMVLRRIGLNIPDKAILEGLKCVNWPGRLELVRHNPVVILDGAHNASGARALSAALTEYFKDKKIILVLGILKDKQVKEILQIICPLAYAVIAVKPDNQRALEPHILAQLAAGYCERTFVAPDIYCAIQKGLSLADKHDVLLITGSLYLIGSARKYFKP